MPHYFFNVRNGRSQDDSDGALLAGLKAARLAAIQRFGKLMAERPEDFEPGHDWRIEVTDASGLMLFQIDLDLSLVASPSIRDV